MNMTSLLEACEQGSLEDVKQLIENGADVHEKNEDGKTALFIAVELERLDLVKYLVEKNANVNDFVIPKRQEFKIEKGLLFPRYAHVLHFAIRNGSRDIVKFLVENGADLDYVQGEREISYFHFAASSGSLQIVKYLVEYGTDVNHENKWKATALHYAASSGSIEIVKYLVEHGADVNDEDKWKGTALHCAASNGYLEIVKHLVEHEADVNHEDEWKKAALHHAVPNGSFEIVKYLVEHGADVNHENEWNETALHVAVKRGLLEIVKYLVEHGADVNWKDEENGTPLHVAVNCGHFEVAKPLIEHGADGENEKQQKKYSLICLACEEGYKSFVDSLLRSEIVKSIDKCSGCETSPLSIACSRGDTEMVRTLLKYNVDVRKENKLECGNDEIINILELELNKSVKHREKIQILRSMDDEELTKVTPPLRCFVANPNFSLGAASSATFVYVGIMEDESEVAVKRMFTESCSQTAENETNILSLINTKKSPFIVNYRHFFHDETFMYLILDLCEETLRELVHSQTIEYLRQHGPRMIKQILTGLEFLHELGILHRDLKPDNVLVDVDGRMRLADFGISRVLEEDKTTHHTVPKGTLGWMAAEVIETIDQEVKCRYKKKSDVQVVGMIAYFILAKGEHLFGPSFARMVNIVNGNPVNLEKLVNLDARQFVSWLVSHKLEDRPYSHEALQHSFLDGVADILQRPQISRI